MNGNNRSGTADAVCHCGHDLGVHRHVRAGEDCGLCRCAHYRRGGDVAEIVADSVAMLTLLATIAALIVLAVVTS